MIRKALLNQYNLSSQYQKIFKFFSCKNNNYFYHNKYKLIKNQIATRKYTRDHEWVDYDISSKTGVIGITDFAAKELGDIVHIEFPDIGTKFTLGQSIGSIESVKVAADVYAPLDGEILQVNEQVTEDPSLINTDAFASWLLKAKVNNDIEIEKMMDKEEYYKYVKEQQKETQDD
ncbi:hypothetical protein IMG5_029330 [Ichthyophthirius multifiliis]|uniref:Glycine cleavage system H protein n=1 Tax=Ichthyophthirius multifiliis TaxID=5932 RepID=G0QLE2_ICHMU|nr:hypothetical protein IMG5_029330 [Ichthyophthirius multifiliis]EGR33966.1 hypothetical protein IMG5_029330 [Ichthyophthirius multifiliis]|eukprot:XP_004039270.1 hypothetical protein IMG5_029330 [Ichthyophthirius multifiliis]